MVEGEVFRKIVPGWEALRIFLVRMGKNKELRRAENKKANNEASILALAECSKKLDVLTAQTNKLSLKIASTQRLERTSALAINFIAQTGQETDRYYSQVGRMFLKENAEEVDKGLRNAVAESKKDLEKLTKTLEQFEKLRKEQIEQMKELTVA